MVPETFQASDAGLSDLFASARKAAEQVPDVLNNDRFVDKTGDFCCEFAKLGKNEWYFEVGVIAVLESPKDLLSPCKFTLGGVQDILIFRSWINWSSV